MNPMDDNFAQLSHEAHGEKTILTFNAEIDISDMMDIIERLLFAAGYAKKSIDEGFIDKAERIELDRESEEDNGN